MLSSKYKYNNIISACSCKDYIFFNNIWGCHFKRLNQSSVYSTFLRFISGFNHIILLHLQYIDWIISVQIYTTQVNRTGRILSVNSNVLSL